MKIIRHFLIIVKYFQYKNYLYWFHNESGYAVAQFVQDDTNVVIRICKSTDRQHDGHKKKDGQRSIKHYTEN
jgi:hypothetical protein